MTKEMFDLNTKRIHFIGICGTGMFPLAQILHSKGYSISGSDISQSDTFQQLKSLNIQLFNEHKKSNLENVEFVIYSSAIDENNEELIEANSNETIRCFERMDFLGFLSTQYEQSICVSGTHGKTTTTAMLTQIFVSSNFDPTVVIGGYLPLIGGNGRNGTNQLFLCESCEYKLSFLKLNPTISIILNIDYEHVDYFSSVDQYVDSFRSFLFQTKKICFVNGDDPFCRSIIKDCSISIIKFGFSDTNDYYPSNIEITNEKKQMFQLNKHGNVLGTIELSVFGRHNILNAVASICCALEFGVTFQQCFRAIKQFQGVKRRFEIIFQSNGIYLIDDYAHHPTEIKITLNTAKQLNFKRIFVIFQAHTFSRFHFFFDQFIEALNLADFILIIEIDGARERNVSHLSAKSLVKKMNRAVFFDTFQVLFNFILKFIKPGDAILTIGPGNISELTKVLKSVLEENVCHCKDFC